MKKVRVGIFGLSRGANYIESFLLCNAEIVAGCDSNEERLKDFSKKVGGTAALYTDVEEFMKHDMDAVFLANYFHQHATYAVRFLEKGIHVLSECTSNATMADGVALVRAAEKSKAIYMLAENYPYMVFNQEMKRVCDGGTLGKILYAEGEYNHPVAPANAEFARIYRPTLDHWRHFGPRSYYVTHSLAPIMHMTGAIPKKVNAFAVFDPIDESEPTANQVGDRATVMTTLNSDGSVFKFVGCSAFGAEGNSYRVCGENGQIENLRGMGNTVMLRYNPWSTPEGKGWGNEYKAEYAPEDKPLAEKAGHGGSDFFVAREFIRCITENRKPDFDVYFATTMASVAIMAHRSVLSGGQAFDIPDLHLEEERKKYENDRLSPFPDAAEEDRIPCCSHPDYAPTEEQKQKYLELLKQK
ncbi:MAG: Gfo/Idh/MocA family oxidoreductase [Clostridiales bacterium]|nr:Gfo/Idh/MocA family oxidoreductase [Clostridiales bacterium]